MSSPQQCSYTTSIGLPPPVAIGDQVGRPANHRFCCACFPKEQQSAVPQEHPSQFFNRARGTKKEGARHSSTRSPSPGYSPTLTFMTLGGGAARHDCFSTAASAV